MHVCHVYEFIAEYCNNVCVLHMCVLTEIRSPIENAARVPKEKLQMSHVQNSRQLILVFGGIYSLKN